MVSVTHQRPSPTQARIDPSTWIDTLRSTYSAPEINKLEKALQFIMPLYQGKTLPLIEESVLQHALGTASILHAMRLDHETLLVALLFCVPDYLIHSQDALTEKFGAPIARLVEGVDKVRKIQELSQANLANTKSADYVAQAEALRKMLLAMVEDIRVVLVKLAWRTQTMHYLRYCESAISRQIATETLDIFAPLANRLGVWQIKWELEDLSLRYLKPEIYKKIAKLLDERRVDREHYITQMIERLETELKMAGILAEVSGRSKHIYSIYRKMQQKNLDFSEVYDVRAVRVLVDNIKDCYTVLGIVHHLWQPIPGEFDDYISHPKGNFYRSLHTAVIGEEDKGVEVQIRTQEMHHHAELGVAAHWRYKEGGKQDPSYEEKIAWLRQVLEWRDEVADQGQLVEKFKTELFQDAIYVLTPQGKVVALPKGATPVDFAYHVHTDLGHRCRGAKVNGHIVPLNTPLENGQRIEILTVKQGGPSLDWLHQGYLKSTRALAKVRHWLKQQNAESVASHGRTLLEKELQRQGLVNPNLEKIAERLRFNEFEPFLIALGSGEIGNRQLSLAVKEAAPPKTDEPETVIIRQSRSQGAADGVLISGVANLMTQLAKCCKPIPPDPLIGFITKGHGASIHRRNCTALKRLSSQAPERLIEASWGAQNTADFPTDVELEAMDRQGLLRDISEVMSRDRINVTAVSTLSKNDRARMQFTMEIRDQTQIQQILSRIREVDGILWVKRR